MAGTLLLISARPEDKVFAAEVAATAELSLECVADPVMGADFIATRSPRVVFVDASSNKIYLDFETAIQEKVGLFSDKVDSNAIHFLSEENLEDVQYLIQSPLFGNFILRQYGDPKEAGRHYGLIVKSALSERAFGLAKLLKAGSKIQVVKMQSSTQKQGAVEAIKNYLLAAKFQARTATLIANGVDEIIMNAMFDAPVDDLGRPVYSTLPRSTAIKLEGKQEVELQIGFDGKYAGITAVDNFGSLDKTKLLAHISKIYANEEYKVKHSVAGAGIGLATVFRSGGSFFFVSESQVRTEVTVMFRRTESFKDFKNQFRFISTLFYFG